MKDKTTYEEAVYVNPMGIDCEHCDYRDETVNMSLTERGKVLCKDCIYHYRIMQVIKHSTEIFTVI